MRRLGILLLVYLLWAAPASAAITVTEKLTGGFGAGAGTTTNLTSYTTSDAFELAASTVGLCFVHHVDLDAAETIQSFVHNSVTWTSIAVTAYTGSSTGRVQAFWAAGAQASSTVTITIDGVDVQAGLMVHCYEVAGADTSTPVAQSKTGTSSAATSHTVTMDSARTSGAALFHAVGAQDAETWTAEYAGVGTEATFATPTAEGRVQWAIGGADTTPLWTSGTTATAGMVAVEIKEAAGGGGSATGCFLLLGVACAP